jgi:hypothetical protein
MGLDIGMVTTKEFFRPLNGKGLRDVHKFTPSVIALSGIPLGVLIGKG